LPWGSGFCQPHPSELTKESAEAGGFVGLGVTVAVVVDEGVVVGVVVVAGTTVDVEGGVGVMFEDG
jgi:hypothetical protein